MKQLEKIIKQKDKIFHSIQKDQQKRYKKLLSQLQNDTTIQEYEIKATIEVYDKSSQKLLTTIYSTFLEDMQLYDLKNIYNIDLKACQITYMILQDLGLNGIKQKLIIWSDVVIKNQKYFVL